MTDTIFALSSGAPPAAIAVVRISGPATSVAVTQISGDLPRPRFASLRKLRSQSGEVLDEALVSWFPAPNSATGEDCAELHCHGGRAVVAAVLARLAECKGLRPAEPGEFTRRAFGNGKLDLAQAEALGDLLAAETELQRKIAQAGFGGAVSSVVDGWRVRLLQLSALVEAALDFSEDDDGIGLPDDFASQLSQLHDEISTVLAHPRAERLRDGVRVVLAGPPNSGKSSLFNALYGRSAAIVTPVPGTTRDVIEGPVSFEGIPFVLVDTAGLREDSADAIEVIGIGKARDAIGDADIVLWLGEEGMGPPGSVEVQSRCDDPGSHRRTSAGLRVSAVTGEGLDELSRDLLARARNLLPKPGDTVINLRQAELLRKAVAQLEARHSDFLVQAEALRLARDAFDRLLGRTRVDDMLDVLFGKFCVGK